MGLFSKKPKPHPVIETQGWKEWKEVRMNDGEAYSVSLSNFRSTGTFEVSWSGGATWGDMGIEFTIKDHAIADESWGD